ncbi:carbamoyltransferase family protein [Kribbella sp. CA-293567]|uniref:carbamoyltransferase family protein n=1 Tax=Kribbella sp. CA-293567 TaxID=3002436 RepID=UPI0022DE90E4|nr:carbamoyltransferase C-terminal domain-containing protein [Kribbella sp. CA-293567]WBQ08304.1 carbamoyltransferase [Kribbella sp. CA-293567]
MRVLGVNAIFHDPSAALVVDGRIVAAAEEERFSRRKHGKRPVPWSAWELPEQAIRWCLAEAGLRPEDLDAVGYSFDPALCVDLAGFGLSDPGDRTRADYARRAPRFLAAALPGLDPDKVKFVPHHVAHAASAGLAAPFEQSACLVLDGRGERGSHLAGRYDGPELTVLAAQDLPHSLGLLYEDLTEHLGFLRSSDEYKVMALASYGKPRHLADFRELIRTTDDGGFRTEPVDWAAYTPKLTGGAEVSDAAADLACSVQRRLEEVLVELATWLHEQTGAKALTMAGGTALNCVANSVIARNGPFDHVWVQPAAGDAGTSLGAAFQLSAAAGRPEPMATAALGREWSDDALADCLRKAALPFETPADLAAVTAQALADNGVIAWYQGRSEYGPRALGHRSLLAHPGRPENLERLNDIKGREQFRPIAPLVLSHRAAEIFDGPLPSPYMLFVHDVATHWRDRIPAVVHVDGTARIQTVDPADEPLLAAVLREFEARTGLPVLVNTSLNTAGRPMVDSPADALELFGSTPVDLLVLGPHVVRRAGAFR